jgi:hypothetical protein
VGQSFGQLASLLDRVLQELRERLEALTRRHFVWIERHVSDEEAARVRALDHLTDWVTPGDWDHLTDWVTPGDYSAAVSARRARREVRTRSRSL